MGNIPETKINFEMNTEERNFIKQVKELPRAQMWQMLEKKRLEELKEKGLQCRTKMLVKARCPKCTLQPPCKHYEKID